MAQARSSDPTITLRAIVLGVGTFAAVVHLLHLSVQAQLSVMALMSFVFWLFFNVLLKTFVPRLALTRGELLTVFVTAFVASSIPANGWMWDIVKALAIPTYVASPENQWEKVLFDILPWHLYADPSPRVISGFWLGLDRGGSIPWHGWIGPMGQWLGVSIALVVFGFCVFVLFHRQWVDVEKLTYPLAQMPLDLTEGCDGPGRVPHLFKSRLFWFGVAVVFLSAAYNSAAYFVPALPKQGLFFYSLDVDLSQHLSREVRFRLMPLVLAVAYLCPLDILASLIVAYWLALPKEWVMNRTGFTVGAEGNHLDVRKILEMESYGALIFIALWSIWLAREHLGAVVRLAMSGARGIDARRYRWALCGLVVSAAYVIGWAMYAGTSFWLAAGLMLLFALVHFATVKLIAATGFAYLFPSQPQLKGDFFITHLTGTEHLSQRSVVGFKVFTSLAFFGSGGRIPAWPAIVHHLRIFSIEKHPVWVTSTVIVAFAVGFIAIAATTITEGYMMKGRFGLSGNDRMFDDMVRLIGNPTVASLGKWAVWLTGFFEAAGIAWMRTRFHWFPFHPVGLAFQQTIGVFIYWFSLTVVWIVKFTLLRYGGVSAYRAGKPLFYGMTVGYVLGIILARGVDRIWFPAVSHWLHRW